MAGNTYSTKTGGKVYVKSTDTNLPDKAFAKESNRVGNQLTVVMKKSLPPSKAVGK